MRRRSNGSTGLWIRRSINLPAGIVVKEINNDFRYVYRNRESYNRDHFSDNPVGKNDYDFYPPIVAEKKRQEDIEVAATGKGLHWIAEGKDRNGNLIILDKRKIKVDGDELSSPIIVSIEGYHGAGDDQAGTPVVEGQSGDVRQSEIGFPRQYES